MHNKRVAITIMCLYKNGIFFNLKTKFNQNATNCTINFFFSGKHAPNPPSKSHGCDMHNSKPVKKKYAAPPPCQIMATPMLNRQLSHIVIL